MKKRVDKAKSLLVRNIIIAAIILGLLFLGYMLFVNSRGETALNVPNTYVNYCKTVCANLGAEYVGAEDNEGTMYNCVCEGLPKVIVFKDAAEEAAA